MSITKVVALAWFAVAVGLVVRTWSRLLLDVVVDWVVDGIDWP